MASSCQTERISLSPLYAEELRTGLAHLPNETLFQILEELPAKELLCLSLTCRRLHFLALPLYFQRHQMPESPTEFHDSNIPALAGLQISLFTNSLRRISLDLQYQTEEPLFRFTRRLKCMLSNYTLSSVEEVKLRVIGFNNWKNLDAWHEVFQEVLALIVSKSCVSLEVQGLIAPLSPGDVYPVPSKYRGRKFSPTRFSPSPKNTPNQLEKFTIHCPSLLRPPYATWTLRTINSSLITNLTLDWRDRHPSAVACGRALKQIFLPRLSRLCICTQRIELKDVWDFATRHPTINDLTLCTTTHRSPTYIAPSAFPQLLSLDTNTQIASFWLESQVAFPQLRRVALASTYFTTGDHPLWHDYLDTTLSHIAKRKTVVTLSLDIRESDADMWMRNCAKHKSRRVLAQQQMRSITRFAVRLSNLEYDAIIGALPGWLASAFPCLEAFVLVRPFFREEDIGHVVQTICKVCPHVKTMGINREERSIEEWLDR